MSVDGNLKATKRKNRGSHACNRLRETGELPAIVYGLGRENLLISVSRRDFLCQLDHGIRHFELDLEGEKLDVIVKDVQYGTYNHIVLHADFELVDANTLVHVHVDIELTGSAPGEKSGGVVEVELHELSIESKVSDIPDKIRVSIDGLAIGHVIHVSDLPAFPGVKILNSPNTPIVLCHKSKVSGQSETGVESK